MAVFNDQAKQAMLSKLRETYFQSCILRLYQNDFTPARTSIYPEFNEADFSGYAPILLNDWFASILTVDDQAEIAIPMKVFFHDGGGVANDIYGYFITVFGMNWVSAERFPSAPLVINGLGDSVPILIKMRLVAPIVL